ncbi:MAG: SMP-30/gluconolactonase/LRE family protein, partial [Suilimivivens sp.]
LDGKLYFLLSNGKRNCISFDQEIGAAVPLERSDGFLVAGRHGLYVAENGKQELLYDLTQEYTAFQRSNDAKADPFGRLWFGSSVADEEHAPDGNLYCFHRNILHCMQSRTKISNGMAWSRDGKKFYFADSLCHAVFVYDNDLSNGCISNRKVLFEVEDGVPDGMCIDENDNLWVAIWGGSHVEQRCTLNGEKLAEIHVSAEHVSSCCFSGDQLDTLSITTAGEGLYGKYDGCLFTCKVDSKGRKPDLAIIDWSEGK